MAPRSGSMPSISSGQVAGIRKWLTESRFKKDCSVSREIWTRGTCSVRITSGRRHHRVEVLHLDHDPRWRKMGRVLAMRANWPGAAVMPPIELATLPQLRPNRPSALFRNAPGQRTYAAARPWAHLVKVILQMIVGIGAVFDVTFHVVSNAVANGSAVHLKLAAVIELAYTHPVHSRPRRSPRPADAGLVSRNSPTDKSETRFRRNTVRGHHHRECWPGRPVPDPALPADKR